MKYLCILSVTIAMLSFFPNQTNAQMDNDKLENIIYVMSDSVVGQKGMWEMQVRGLPMMCITDQTNNRMRIIAPIKESKDVTEEEMKAAMEANFHTALDVRYAVSNDIMWVAFIHPLKELTKDQVINAISQVYNATLTYGTYYTSTELSFGNGGEDEEEKKKNEKILIRVCNTAHL